MEARMLSFTAIRDVLQRSRSIAIVGAKDKAGQPVDRVGRYLLDKGYTIFPVHPVRKTVWGLTAYPDLASLPQPVDIIDLFRAPQTVPPMRRKCWPCPGSPSASGCRRASAPPRHVPCWSLNRSWWWRISASWSNTPACSLCKNNPEDIEMSQETQAFSCKMCGHCCKGKGGIVVSPSDLKRLCATLRMEEEEVIRQFGEYVGTKLKIRVGEDGYCIFFREGKGCIVHEGKPSICKAWPFFRGNIEDPVSLHLAKDFCPGIPKEISHADFAAQGKRYLQENGLLASDRSCEANALILDK